MVDPEDDAGVYVIEFATGEVYVGRSVAMRARWQAHLRDLRAGRHRNRRLQAAWDASECYASFSVVAELAGVRASTLVRHEAWVLAKLAAEGRPVLNVLAPCREAEKVTPPVRRAAVRRHCPGSLAQRFRQERELLILKATAELAGELGWHGWTLGEVAARVGIRTSTIHLHFARKGDLIAAVRERGIAPAGKVCADPSSGPSAADDRME